MYERQSRLGARKRSRLIECFVAGRTARAAAGLVGVHRKTAASFHTRLGKAVAGETAKAPPFAGEMEVDENDFGGTRKGRRGRGRVGKSPGFRAVEAWRACLHGDGPGPTRTPRPRPIIAPWDESRPSEVGPVASGPATGPRGQAPWDLAARMC